MPDNKNLLNTDFVIFQWPNAYLWTMIVAWAVSYFFTTGYIYAVSRTVFYIAGVIWAYEEIVHGANWFRRLLGAAVMIILFIGIANQI